jgi:hypothetical protein
MPIDLTRPSSRVLSIDNDSMTLTNQVDMDDGSSDELGEGDKSPPSIGITLEVFVGKAGSWVLI